jgi:crotonobetainyl-CoA:carnitine CoA-transferase CaiB-like acyl-CoA transferase
MKTNPFSDLKIIELASVLAGPSVGMFFAELGAKVIKVENLKTNGDVTRGWYSKHESKDQLSSYYSSVNWGKEVRLLDFTLITDYKLLIKEVKTADIIISSYKKGDDKRLNVDYETLKTYQPKLIYGHISGYGEDSNRTGYDALIQAESGFMAMNGYPDGKPAKMPVALIDILAAHQLKEGLLVALINKYKNNCGDYVSVSLMDAAVSSLANQGSHFLATGKDPERLGSEHPSIVPYGTLFITNDDRYFVTAIGADHQFERFCDILGLNDLAEDKRFQTNQERVIYKSDLIPLLQNAIGTFSSEDLIQKCLDGNIPCGLVNQLSEVFKADFSHLQIDGNNSKGLRTIAFQSEQLKLNHLLSDPDNLS